MKLSFHIILLLATYGCKHQADTFSIEPVPACLEIAHEDSCEDFQLIPGPFGIEEFRNGLGQYLYPSVNPNNPNEFVYLFAPSGDGIPQWTIRKHNASTHEDVYMVDSPFNTHIALNWGSDGWIAITGSAGKIYLIKEDGSMFHFLMNSGSVSDSPMDWLDDGKRFLYYKPNAGTNNDIHRIANLAGETIDSMFVIVTKMDINNKNQAIGLEPIVEGPIATIKVKIYDLNTRTENFIWQYSMNHYNDKISDFEWLPGNQHCIFLKDEGLFKLDINTGIVTQIKESCNNKHIVSIDVSESGRYILYTKRIRRVINITTIGWMDEIWKMDLNGCNEERVLPQ
jgi:hypothetical protein